MHAATLTIARLHAHASTREPLIARLAAEALAAEVAAALPPLPPQSVLMLRRLALALPRRALERLPDAGLRLQVANAARSAIADAAAHAGRPALGPVAADAPAVWFGDEAELLACLARDALAGRLDHWWWRQLLGRAHPDWISAWVDRPALTAAALRLLARTGLLTAACKVLAPRGVLAWLPALPDSVPGPGPDARGPAPGAASTPPVSAASAPATVPPTASAARPASPDDGPAAAARTAHDIPGAALPPPTADAGAPDSALAGARASIHAQAIGTVTHQAAGPGTMARPRTQDGASVQARPEQAAPLRHKPDAADTEARAHSNSAQFAQPATRSHDSAATPDQTPRVSALADAPVPQATPPARAHVEPGALTQPRRAPGVDTPLAPPAQRRAAPTHTHPQTQTKAQTPGPAATLDAAPHVVITRYGRLLFLVNVLLGDGLYPDFTRPLDPAFPLPLWRLLMLIGDRLIGPALQHDPLWSLLDNLAADGAQDGAVRDLAQRWPVPAPPPLRRLRAARRQAGPAHVHRPHPRRLRHAPAGALARWLARYVCSLRARLAPALATPPALVGRAFAGAAAQLWVSEGEIVLVMPLDGHPVAWRLAGLDRDPGPLPGTGRSLRLVFD